MDGVRRDRALVTGAAGFIGSHVAAHCLELGFETVAVDDLSGGFRENVPAEAIWEEGDVRNGRFVREIFERHAPIDYVYHLAAYAAEGLSHFIRAYNYRTNLEATVNLVNEAVRWQSKRFVFASSIAVYGAGQVPMIESLQPRPEDPYGISKYAAELDLSAAAEMFGLPYTVFRPHNVYGERQNVADPYRNVVGIFMSAGLARRTDADLRRRHTDARVLTHRRRRPRDRRGPSVSRVPSIRSSTSAPTLRSPSPAWLSSSLTRSAFRTGSSTYRSAARLRTRLRIIRKCAPPSGWESRLGSRRDSCERPAGCARPGCATRSHSRASSRSGRECLRVGIRAGKRGSVAANHAASAARPSSLPSGGGRARSSPSRRACGRAGSGPSRPRPTSAPSTAEPVART